MPPKYLKKKEGTYAKCVIGEGSSKEPRKSVGGAAIIKLLDQAPAEPSPPPALALKKAGPKTKMSASLQPPASSLEPPMDTMDVDIDGEDDILLDPPRAEEKTLLALRQSYKRTRSNLSRVASHLEFIETCIDHEKTPRGLQVHVRCNALLTDLSNIKEKFANTKNMAEHEFTDSLKSHYTTAKSKLEKDLLGLNKEIDQQRKRATPQDREEHDQMFKKTEDNLAKQEKELDQRKKRKLDGLSRPPPTREERTGRRKPYNSSSTNNARPIYGSRPNYRGRQPNNNPGQSSTQAPRNNPIPPTPTNVVRNVQENQQPTAPLAQNIDLTTMTNMFNQLMQQAISRQQPAQLMPAFAPGPQQVAVPQRQPVQLRPPCAPGLQPPMLQAPGVNVQYRQPPPLSGLGQQGF